jgi:peptidoglycan LD-endopeptidase LytH
MAVSGGKLKTVSIAIYLIGIHLLLVGLLYERFFLARSAVERVDHVHVPDLASAPQVTPAVIPSTTPLQIPSAAPTAEAPAEMPLPRGGLLIPVRGVRPGSLTDTFADVRSEERSHNAIDIAAPAGTEVLAAADGTIIKFFDSHAGGITIYQLTTDGRYFLYYAHLQSRASGINEGQVVPQGTVIGYVGDTGNAGPGNYHLHFAVSAVRDPKRFWDGTPINPFPLLRDGSKLP